MAERNFKNRTLFHGDNIDFLRAMNTDTVDLIATDPPFNKGRDFHATPDSLAAGASFQDRWKWDEENHPRRTDAIKNDWADVWTVIESARASWGDDMGAFLCFMGTRLIEMHRVLKPTGSIYLHCDPTASHYLKALMDAVFGRKNFRNEIVWHYGLGGFNVKHWFPRKHDVLLYYARSSKSHHNKIRGNVSKWMDAKYSQEDENGRYFVQDGVKYYLKGGKPIDTVWDHDELIEHTMSQTSSERTGYPTQKPLAVYERIIQASSNEGDLVLDPFAGCATTAVAAERLNRQWVTIDLWKETKDLIVQRLEAEERMLAVEHLTVTKTPPERTDEGEVASRDLRPKIQLQPEKWKRLYYQEIFDYLETAQTNATGLVTCAGCGRSLDLEFMEIDHVVPRKDGGENFITNRILLCVPCGEKKTSKYTLHGLQMKNKKDGWMRDEAKAESAHLRARHKADEVRDTLR